jgi:hypothetical protein
MLGTAFLQTFFSFSVGQAGALTFMILTSIVYLLTETLVIFFFVGTGVSIKEYTLERRLKTDFHHKSIAIKRKVYPPLLLNMLCMIILFIGLGGVDTGKVAVEWYRGYFLLCLAHFIYAKMIQHHCFKDNTFNILEMSGIAIPGREQAA